jgi:hypothetical protein
MIIHLKTKPKPGAEQRFAILIDPEFIPTPKMSPEDNDKELIQAIKDHGEAVIHEFEVTNPFQLKRNRTFLSPEQLEAEWIGD